MQRVGVCGQSINNWRKAYRNGGISQLLSHKKTGFKPSVFSPEEKTELGKLVENPKNGIVGYIELQRWVKEQFDKDVKYITLVKCMQHNYLRCAEYCRLYNRAADHIEKVSIHSTCILE